MSQDTSHCCCSICEMNGLGILCATICWYATVSGLYIMNDVFVYVCAGAIVYLPLLHCIVGQNLSKALAKGTTLMWSGAAG